MGKSLPTFERKEIEEKKNKIKCLLLSIEKELETRRIGHSEKKRKGKEKEEKEFFASFFEILFYLKTAITLRERRVRRLITRTLK
jgi:hypothetical protein